MDPGELRARLDRCVKCGCKQCETEYWQLSRELCARAFRDPYRAMSRSIIERELQRDTVIDRLVRDGIAPVMTGMDLGRETTKAAALSLGYGKPYIPTMLKEAKMEPKEVNWDPAIKVLLDKRNSAESTHKAYAETVKTYRASLKSSVANEKKAARELASYQRALKKLGYKD